jgi:hypothetical protein
MICSKFVQWKPFINSTHTTVGVLKEWKCRSDIFAKIPGRREVAMLFGQNLKGSK